MRRALLFGLVGFVCAGSATTDPSSMTMEDFGALRIKELRKFLNDRKVACNGCVEKKHLVQRSFEVRDTPVVEVEEPPKEGGKQEAETKSSDSPDAQPSEPESAAAAETDAPEEENQEEKDKKEAATLKKDKQKKKKKEEAAKAKKKKEAAKNKKKKEAKEKDKKETTDEKEEQTEKKKTEKKDKSEKEEDNDQKGEQKKGGTMAEVWGRKTKKMCDKKAKRTASPSFDVEELCKTLGASIKEQVESFSKTFSNVNTMNMNNLNDLSSMLGGKKKGNSEMKKNSMKQPHRSKGLSIIRKNIDAAFVLAEEHATNPTDEKQSEPTTEPLAAEAKDSEDSDVPDKLPEKPQTYAEKLEEIARKDVMMWLFDISFKSKKNDYSDFDYSKYKPADPKDDESSPPTPRKKRSPPTPKKRVPPTPPTYIPKTTRRRQPEVEEEEEEDIVDLDAEDEKDEL